MKTIIPIIALLLLCGCNEDKTRRALLKDLSDSSFDSGAKIGYSVKAYGGSKDDLEVILDAFHSNDIPRADAVFERLLRAFQTVTNSPTYTVTVAGDLWKHTNCVAILPCTDACTLVRYVDNGVTNEFHAWAVPVNVETNK